MFVGLFRYNGGAASPGSAAEAMGPIVENLLGHITQVPCALLQSIYMQLRPGSSAFLHAQLGGGSTVHGLLPRVPCVRGAVSCYDAQFLQ